MRLPVKRSLYLFLRFFSFPVTWEISAGAITFRESPKGREYLLLKYPSGHFDYPRGHVEAGETRLEAARREVYEETGIDDIQIFAEKEMKTQFFYIARGNESVRRKGEARGTWIFKEVYMYPGLTKTKEIALSEEHPEFMWLPYEEAVKQVTFENAKKILVETEKWARGRTLGQA